MQKKRRRQEIKTNIRKIFLDVQEEEEWPNEQRQDGQMLIGYHGGGYVFEDIFPLKYQYKIDLSSYTGSKEKEYLGFLERTEITVVAEYGGRVYPRKNVVDGPLDIYSGKEEIEEQMSKRYSHFFGVAVSQLIPGILMLVQTLYCVKPGDVPFWIAIAVDADLVISGIISLIVGIQIHRKYAVPEGERDI